MPETHAPVAKFDTHRHFEVSGRFRELGIDHERHQVIAKAAIYAEQHRPQIKLKEVIKLDPEAAQSPDRLSAHKVTMLTGDIIGAREAKLMTMGKTILDDEFDPSDGDGFYAQSLAEDSESEPRPADKPRVTQNDLELWG